MNPLLPKEEFLYKIFDCHSKFCDPWNYVSEDLFNSDNNNNKRKLFLIANLTILKKPDSFDILNEIADKIWNSDEITKQNALVFLNQIKSIYEL